MLLRHAVFARGQHAVLLYVLPSLHLWAVYMPGAIAVERMKSLMHEHMREAGGARLSKQ